MLIWKDIQGYEGIYQISSLGQIKSLDRIDCMGQHRKEKILAISLDSDGYPITILSKDKIRKTCKNHRIVAIHFIPNPEQKKEVNHKNGIKTDNRVDNLEWATAKENQKHSRRIGLHKEIGETHKFAKLTNKQVLEIFHSDEHNKVLSEKNNIGILAIQRIKSGHKWSSITGKFYNPKKRVCV